MSIIILLLYLEGNTMKRFLYFLLALFFPWFVFFMQNMRDKALVALGLQASLFGWIFATIWAWGIVKQTILAEDKKNLSE